MTDKLIQTQDEYIAWATEHHPAVVAALQAGNATITLAPTGFAWFGSKYASVRISRFFRDSYLPVTREEGWPSCQPCGQWMLELQRVEDGGGYAWYKLSEKYHMPLHKGCEATK